MTFLRNRHNLSSSSNIVLGQKLGIFMLYFRMECGNAGRKILADRVNPPSGMHSRGGLNWTHFKKAKRDSYTKGRFPFKLIKFVSFLKIILPYNAYIFHSKTSKT